MELLGLHTLPLVVDVQGLVGNPIIHDVARVAAAAVVIQAFYRGEVDRRLASGLAAYLLYWA